jgi:hypothetical protein
MGAPQVAECGRAARLHYLYRGLIILLKINNWGPTQQVFPKGEGRKALRAYCKVGRNDFSLRRAMAHARLTLRRTAQREKGIWSHYRKEDTIGAARSISTPSEVGVGV